MSKTIEEAAKDYAYDMGDSDWERMLLQDAFIDGINHIMQLPLCDRLTAKEKERMRKIYYDAERGEVNGHYDVYPDPCEVMRVIFGKDFFKDE